MISKDNVADAMKQVSNEFYCGDARTLQCAILYRDALREAYHHLGHYIQVLDVVYGENTIAKTEFVEEFRQEIKTMLGESDAV